MNNTKSNTKVNPIVNTNTTSTNTKPHSLLKIASMNRLHEMMKNATEKLDFTYLSTNIDPTNTNIDIDTDTDTNGSGSGDGHEWYHQW